MDGGGAVDVEGIQVDVHDDIERLAVLLSILIVIRKIRIRFFDRLNL